MAGLYANAFGKSHQDLSLEDLLLAAAAKLNRCPLWTWNQKHYPMEDIQLFSRSGAAQARISNAPLPEAKKR